MEIIRNVIRDIKPEYWVALGAAVSILSLMVAGFSLIYVRRSAKASREQTKQQKQAAKDAAQPMLWVDVRGDDGQGQALVLMLGNSGPSIARNVKVVFDPAPPSTLDIKPILEILKQGHRLRAAWPHDALGFGYTSQHNRLRRAQRVPSTHRGRRTLRPHRAARVRDQRR
jgi:hypothetical protein